MGAMRQVMLGGVLVSACQPVPWNGPVLTEPRDQLTVDDLRDGALPPLLDMSFLARPAWATGDGDPFVGALDLGAARLAMDFPATRALYAGEDLFPPVTIDLVADGGRLIPRTTAIVSTASDGDSLWDVAVGVGAVWREADDGGWNRGSFPIDLVDRFFNQVRNCVATFVYRGDETSRTYVQCSQETADADDAQLGNLAAFLPTAWVAGDPGEGSAVVAAHERTVAERVPTRPLDAWDTHGELAAIFDRSWRTNASTSVGAVYADGVLFVHPARTRHGLHPYPDEMRHGVYSVTKSLAAAVALFHVAQRYGPEVLDARVVDHVPALADAPGWQDVTFVDALDMATGTNGGEAGDQLYEPLVLAETRSEALVNIAALGDAPDAPGEVFRYATTNTFVLSNALQHLVEAREGQGVGAWAQVRADVLEPVGAAGLEVLFTRDPEVADRIPYLGYGARPTLDQAVKVARLLAHEGEHAGGQLLHRDTVRDALGRTSWAGLTVDARTRYGHGFWRRTVDVAGCTVEAVFMQGHGGHHVVFLPSGVILFRFMDEQADDVDALVRAAERVRSSCDR